MNTELVVFIVYLCFMIGIGVYFFVKGRGSGEKEYFLGGRKMGPWVSALSAGASDMSAWVLMGLPASIYAAGIGQAWIAIGLAVGYALSWIFEAPRLRRFSIAAEACGTLFQTVCGNIFIAGNDLLNQQIFMYIAAAIIIGYTFMGGFSAVCWTDFFQGLLMLGALLIAPIFALGLISGGQGQMTVEALSQSNPDYWNLFPDWKTVASGLGWGLGYFGMPHIIIRFMSVRSDKDLRKSAKIGISWNVLIILFSVAGGCIGHLFLGEVTDSSTVFIQMVRTIFPAVISGILLSAILAAAMSTADSQLLCASSAFASDVYKPVIRKNKSTDKEMFWVGRYVVLIIAVIAVLIASNPNSQSIMDLVSNAWGIFGAAFGPAILLSLFWKRFTFRGAVAGIASGAAVDIAWLILGQQNPGSIFGLYEIIPGFVVGLLFAIVVSLIDKAPKKEVEDLFDLAVSDQID